jgi:hypothetical protein
MYEKAVKALEIRQKEIATGIWVQKTFTEHEGDYGDKDTLVVSTDKYTLWVNTQTGERLASLKLDDPNSILASYKSEYIGKALKEVLFEKWCEMHYGSDCSDLDE